ncbi:MAG: hypothetical protein WCX64_04770 [Candidatus Micrarchaeia archaeon]|jgi:hypothetical protein
MPTETTGQTKYTVSLGLFQDHCNPLFAAYGRLQKGKPKSKEERDALEGLRQDFVKRMRAAAEQITEETGGITKSNFYEIANVAAGQAWDSPEKVNALYGMVRMLGIRGVDNRCESCLNRNGKATLFKDIFKPVNKAISANHAAKRPQEKDAKKLTQFGYEFRHGLSTVMQEHERHKNEISKDAITHLYDWAKAADWERPEELEAIYAHGSTLFGQPARPTGNGFSEHGPAPQLASHAGITDSREALADALNHPTTAAQLHSPKLARFPAKPADFESCRNAYINKLLFHASNPRLEETGGITRNKLLRLARQARRQDWTKGEDARQAYSRAERMLGKKPFEGLNNAWSGKAHNRPRTAKAARLRR